MNHYQRTAKGETFVMEEDPSTPGLYRPVVIMDEKRPGYRGRWSANQRYYSPRRASQFGTYRGYIPYWYQDLKAHQWDRRKLIAITAVASPIILTVLPRLLALFQP